MRGKREKDDGLMMSCFPVVRRARGASVQRESS